MGLLKRINTLMNKVEPDRPVPMVAVFEDGHREAVPTDTAPCVWAMRRAMEPQGPRICWFESEEDPAAAKDETQFFHCLTEGGDLSHLWDDFGKEAGQDDG